MKIIVEYEEDAFKEGMFVSPKRNPNEVFLVTVPASGYNLEDEQEGTFWAIPLTGSRVSGGNYQKDLFIPFRGKIVIEV